MTRAALDTVEIRELAPTGIEVTPGDVDGVPAIPQPQGRVGQQLFEYDHVIVEHAPGAAREAARGAAVHCQRLRDVADGHPFHGDSYPVQVVLGRLQSPVEVPDALD